MFHNSYYTSSLWERNAHQFRINCSLWLFFNWITSFPLSTTIGWSSGTTVTDIIEVFDLRARAGGDSSVFPCLVRGVWWDNVEGYVLVEKKSDLTTLDIWSEVMILGGGRRRRSSRGHTPFPYSASPRWARSRPHIRILLGCRFRSRFLHGKGSQVVVVRRLAE